MSHEHVWVMDPIISSRKINRYRCSCGRYAWREWRSTGLTEMTLYVDGSDSLKSVLGHADRERRRPWGDPWWG